MAHSGPAPPAAPRFDFLAPAQGPDELGRLGSYRIRSVLGRGGMGVVFSAENLILDRKVALKVLAPELAVNPIHRRRFLREARLAASVEHEHVVTIYRADEENGVAFLEMPLLQGESLRSQLRRLGTLPVPVIVRFGRETAQGLQAAHRRGLIHRDVKPGNIWLEPLPDETETAAVRARVKILDFGLAREMADTAHLTRTGAILGTPSYMAPEQAKGGRVDARSDLFSLGCVLYEMATGVRAFPGTDMMVVLSSVCHDQPPVPAAVNPTVPSDLSRLIMQLLAKDPGSRPATARDVDDALAGIEGTLHQVSAVSDQNRGSTPGDSRKTIPFENDPAEAQLRLGNALWLAGRPEEALLAWRAAIELNQNLAAAHAALGTALANKGLLGEGIAELRAAVRLQKEPAVCCNLGLALEQAGRLDEAIVQYRAAISQDREFAAAHGNLGVVLLKTGSLDEAVASCQRAIRLDREEALRHGYRYNAACWAAKTGCGQGGSAAGDVTQRGRWRRQALEWLRADLEAWLARLAREPTRSRAEIAETMGRWLRDADFNAVRRPEALAQLPAVEQLAWLKLWAEVAATQARAKSMTEGQG
jgi:serine/threonine protein kinase